VLYMHKSFIVRLVGRIGLEFVSYDVFLYSTEVRGRMMR